MKQIILVAYDINPNLGSESGFAFQWLKIASKYCKMVVFTDGKHRQDLENSPLKNVSYRYIDCSGPLCMSAKKVRFFAAANRIFIKRVHGIIGSFLQGSDYIHIITPAGVHSKNDLYKHGVPTIIGPLGGALITPRGFEQLFRKSKVRDNMRSMYYSVSLKSRSWQKYIRAASKILVGTPNVKELLPADEHKKVSIVFDTLVDPEVFKPLPQAKPKGVNACYVGQLEPKKGCEMLLKAISAVKTVSLDIVGTGYQRKYLEGLAKSLGIQDRVKFHGRIPRDDVKKVLSRSQIFVLPSIREPGGSSILEAMSMSLPVIATDYGGPSYSVSDTTGIKIRPGSYGQYIKDLAAAIMKLAKNPGLCARLGRNGRKRVIEMFSPSALERQIRQVYEV